MPFADYFETEDDQGQGGAPAAEPGGQPAGGPAQPQQPDWTQVATTMPTWNQGDEIDLQRLTNGASYIRNQTMSGRWGDATAQAMTSQLNEQLGPLMVRKAQASQFAEQQQQQAALKQNALVQGIATADRVAQAKSFPGTIQELYNPNTGGIDRYIPDGKGGWQIQAADPVASPNAGAGGGSGEEGGSSSGGEGVGAGPPPPADVPLAPDGKPYGDQPRFRTVAGQDGVARQQRIPTQAEYEAMQNATPEQQVGIADRIARGTFQASNPAGPGGTQPGFTGSIENGPYRETFDQGALTGTNRPAAQSEGGGAGGGTAQDFHNQALGVVGPAPQQFYRGAHGQLLPNPQYSRWLADVRQTATELHKEHRQQISLDRRDALERSREDHREKLQQQRQDFTDRQKQQGEKSTAWDSMYKDHLGALQKEWDYIRLHEKDKAAPGKRPEEFQDRQSMEAEAEKRTDADFMRGHGHLPETRQAILGQRALDKAAADKKNNAPPPPHVVERLSRLANEDAKTHADVAARSTPAPVSPIAGAPGASKGQRRAVDEEARKVRQLLGLE